MSLPELLSLTLLCLLAWFWFDSLKAREAGVLAARTACAREGVQLLDETVVGRGLSLKRDDDGRMAIRRAYDFEYSDTGYDRHRGSVVMMGREVVMLDLAAHRSDKVRQLF